MKKYVLDTDTCIYWIKGNKRIERKIVQAGMENIRVTIITECELYYGALKSERKEGNVAVIKNLLRQLKTLHTQPGMSYGFGEIKAHLEKEGSPLDDADILIACIARHADHTLVTNNVSHFKRVRGLTLENWV